ncbi:MAG: hypothetical protein CMH83_12485 [Nocardioides sp.]|nr:hypothetical protein [Nocardioides sp.]
MGVNDLDHDAFTALYGGWAGRTPADAAVLMRDYPGTWAVAGGWAVEAFTGVARPHEDTDLVVLRSELPLLRRHLAGRLHVWGVSSGAMVPLLEDDPDGDPDALLPDGGAGQVWTRRSATDPWEYDVLLDPGTPEEWVCKRDHAIRLPRTRAVVTYDGVPHLAAEVQLLMKAKGDRPKDRADLEAAVPLLDAERRSWLRDAVAALHPGHPWLDRLA